MIQQPQQRQTTNKASITISIWHTIISRWHTRTGTNTKIKERKASSKSQKNVK